MKLEYGAWNIRSVAVRSVPMISVPSRRTHQALPGEGRPGPSDYDDDGEAAANDDGDGAAADDDDGDADGGDRDGDDLI